MDLPQPDSPTTTQGLSLLYIETETLNRVHGGKMTAKELPTAAENALDILNGQEGFAVQVDLWLISFMRSLRNSAERGSAHRGFRKTSQG